MTMWVAVLSACAIAYLIKLGGYLVPQQVLEVPWIERVVPLLTIALLSALVVTQGFLDAGGMPTVDARAAGIGAAVLLLVLRAPFLVVVATAAVVAALVRLWT